MGNKCNYIRVPTKLQELELIREGMEIMGHPVLVIQAKNEVERIVI